MRGVVAERETGSSGHVPDTAVSWPWLQHPRVTGARKADDPSDLAS
jgi:hypothetical protein